MHCTETAVFSHLKQTNKPKAKLLSNLVLLQNPLEIVTLCVGKGPQACKKSYLLEHWLESFSLREILDVSKYASPLAASSFKKFRGDDEGATITFHIFSLVLYLATSFVIFLVVEIF